MCLTGGIEATAVLLHDDAGNHIFEGLVELGELLDADIRDLRAPGVDLVLAIGNVLSAQHLVHRLEEITPPSLRSARASAPARTRTRSALTDGPTSVSKSSIITAIYLNIKCNIPVSASTHKRSIISSTSTLLKAVNISAKTYPTPPPSISNPQISLQFSKSPLSIFCAFSIKSRSLTTFSLKSESQTL